MCSVGATLVIGKFSVMLLWNWEMNWFVRLSRYNFFLNLSLIKTSMLFQVLVFVLKKGLFDDSTVFFLGVEMGF